MSIALHRSWNYSLTAGVAGSRRSYKSSLKQKVIPFHVDMLILIISSSFNFIHSFSTKVFLKVCVISQRKSIHTYAMRKRTKIQGHPNRMFRTSIIGFCLKWMPQWLIYIRKIVLYCTSTSFVNALHSSCYTRTFAFLFSEIPPEFGIFAQIKVLLPTLTYKADASIQVRGWTSSKGPQDKI